MVAEGQNPKIIVSYRRADSAMAGRIFDRLAQHFGKTNLFIDIDNVPFGVDFRKHIDDALQASNILIAIVGEKWLGPKADGKLRIMSDADPVRVELETALRRGITVLPVLIDGTSMPDPAELPDTIRDFAYRNAVEVESGRDFNVHVEAADPRRRADRRRQGYARCTDAEPDFPSAVAGAAHDEAQALAAHSWSARSFGRGRVSSLVRARLDPNRRHQPFGRDSVLRGAQARHRRGEDQLRLDPRTGVD